MSNTILELTRSGHEDIERLEHLIVKDLKNEVRTHQEKLFQNHRIKEILNVMQIRAAKLVQIYEDEDNSRKEEISNLAGDNIFSKFYDRLKDIKDYYRRYPCTDITEAENDDDLLNREPKVEFSGEESLGQHLDLHEHYNFYINSRFGTKMEYYEYLTIVTKFENVPRHHKTTNKYREYIEKLLSYLESFYERAQPLSSLSKHYFKLEEEFEHRWVCAEIPGWRDGGTGTSDNLLTAPGAIDLNLFKTIEELEDLGMDGLKAALQALGLKCGGTKRQRAERLFILKDISLDKMDPKHFSKACVGPYYYTEEKKQKQIAIFKEIAMIELKINKIIELLGSVLEDTKGKVERKQAQTLEELQEELLEQEREIVEGNESDEDDEYIYNPLKLPLGWDGKPIPYWLYKLHGLNQEFKCEICGNYSYWGRRAFEKHFKEWRHQNGMRALGVPNNKNFYEITKIEDAVALWENIKRRDTGGWRPEIDEEFEDEHGNVYNKKTYEDLKRQGLIG